jgi:hypothetical protein
VLNFPLGEGLHFDEPEPVVVDGKEVPGFEIFADIEKMFFRVDLNDDAVVKDEIERLDEKIGLALFEDVADDDEDMVWSFLKRF